MFNIKLTSRGIQEKVADFIHFHNIYEFQVTYKGNVMKVHPEIDVILFTDNTYTINSGNPRFEEEGKFEYKELVAIDKRLREEALEIFRKGLRKDNKFKFIELLMEESDFVS